MEACVCPRCGYDQRGVIATWGESSCPLRGVCSECGLDLDWGLVLTAERRRPGWLFEHTPGMRRTLWACVRNGWSSLDGRAWWRRVRLEHVVRPVRLPLLIVVWLVMLHLYAVVVGVVCTGLSVWWRWQQTKQYYPGGWNAQWDRLLEQQIASAATWPYGAFIGGAGRWRGVFNPDPIDFVVWWGLALLLSSMAFLLLPVTMGKAGVRRVHLLRGLVHGAPVTLACALLVCAADWGFKSLDLLPPMRVAYIGTFGLSDRVVVVMLIVVGWWGCWWWRFVREYLRLPRAGWIAVVVTLLGVLAATTLLLPVEGLIAWVYESARITLLDMLGLG